MFRVLRSTNPFATRSYRLSTRAMPFLASYIESDEVAAMVLDNTLKSGKDYLVVDVRDDDFEGGHIPEAIHIRSSILLDKLDDLVNEYANVPKIVFHCVMSQVRGPKSAQMYKETLSLNGIQTQQQVYVLRGGFRQWQARFKNDPDMIADYRPELWASEFDDASGSGNVDAENPR
ncbi:Rhodanese-like domain-containing protein [Jimgerdemannia flammicorona]|uniref:Rhodanese-like domain-containing protein n=2 Tax=Jimgerdemannia flammicorona TaxID=994334 RepID=A0A433D5Q4_9FUNG|nr:Rhodanese-like domain-containing protein [Jimgerdemannia flammicorona]RUS33126.1 Rhodanese-like domain-containing protein [Jimgerdemannia flammicorona]